MVLTILIILCVLPFWVTKKTIRIGHFKKILLLVIFKATVGLCLKGMKVETVGVNRVAK